MNRRTMMAAACLLAAGLAAPATAQDYPNQTIKLISSFGAGGGSDIIGRIIAQRLQEKLGQPVVVENRPGAGGLLGNEAVANAPKDGYTLGVQTAGQIITPVMTKVVRFEPVESFDWIGQIAVAGLLIVVRPDYPYKDIKSLVAAAKADLQRVLADTSTGRNAFEGFSTRRVYALFAKTRYFDGPGTHPLVLGVLDHVLGHYQFSAPVGIQIGPGEKAQVLHRDVYVFPLPRTGTDVVVNTMWPLDDFTVENGATRFVPGSHRWEPGRTATEEETTAAVMPAGSVLVG